MGRVSSVDRRFAKLEKERRLVLSLIYDERAVLEEKGLANRIHHKLKDLRGFYAVSACTSEKA